MNYLYPILSWIFLLSCSNDNTDLTPNTNNTDQNEIPKVYAKIYGATSITRDGDYVVIKTTGVPDHKSIYHSSSSDLHEDFEGETFDGATFRKNPNTIASFDYTFRIPINPTKAATATATRLGAIGVSLNGVPFFNQYAGPNQPLTNEIRSFDQYWGHPTGTSAYHYHVEPIYLTNVKVTKSSLLGFLLDGFPVYGPEENGKAVSNLDAYHGHEHATEDYPEGIYHYHITNTDPYINGNGYYGTPGTVTH